MLRMVSSGAIGIVSRMALGCYDGKTLVILLAGGTKKRQQTDIDAAKDRWQEYKQRKKEPKGG